MPTESLQRSDDNRSVVSLALTVRLLPTGPDWWSPPAGKLETGGWPPSKFRESGMTASTNSKSADPKTDQRCAVGNRYRRLGADTARLQSDRAAAAATVPENTVPLRTRSSGRAA